jgi:hypothetical protein
VRFDDPNRWKVSEIFSTATGREVPSPIDPRVRYVSAELPGSHYVFRLRKPKKR